MIKVWHSYACNNSSAYRLVARFADAAAADEVVAELDEFFVAQSKVKKRPRNSSPLAVLARNYGEDWIDNGMGTMGVFAEDKTVVVYHTMCLGMGPGVAAYIEDRGGTHVSTSSGGISLTVLFRTTPRTDELAALLAPLFDVENGVLLGKPPWASFVPSGHAVWFRDGSTFGFFVPVKGSEVVGLKAWLAGFGVEDPVLRIDQYDDRELFAALAAARCGSCDRKLDYLDPRLHDIETPQLVCGPCGGLYDLSTFYSP